MRPGTLKTILLDLDDVLNSFTMHSLKLMGCPVGPFDYDKYPRECGYDMVKAYNKLGPQKLTPDQFWRYLPTEVWWTAPMSHEAKVLLSWARAKVGDQNVFIATKPTRCPYSASGKVLWIQSNLPSGMHRNYNITPHKHLMANEHTLLVDDSEKNVMKFVANGGRAILMPRPWNKAYDQHLRLPL